MSRLLFEITCEKFAESLALAGIMAQKRLETRANACSRY
jgi:hypothetical protein